MKKFRKLLLSCMLITLAINLVGCAKENNEEDTSKESVEQSTNVANAMFVDKIIKTIDNKYIVTMPEDLEESMTFGIYIILIMMISKCNIYLFMIRKT